MDLETRYYLTLLDDGTWQITLQNKVDDVWVDQAIEQTYDKWQDAIDSSYSPLAMDPQDNWPVELGGQSGTASN